MMNPLKVSVDPPDPPVNDVCFHIFFTMWQAVNSSTTPPLPWFKPTALFGMRRQSRVVLLKDNI